MRMAERFFGMIMVITMSMLAWQATPAAAVTHTSNTVLRQDFFDVDLCGEATVSDGTGSAVAAGWVHTLLSTIQCWDGAYGGVNNTMVIEVALVRIIGSSNFQCGAPRSTTSPGNTSSHHAFGFIPNTCSGISGQFRGAATFGGYVWGTWYPAGTYPVAITALWVNATAA